MEDSTKDGVQQFLRLGETSPDQDLAQKVAEEKLATSMEMIQRTEHERIVGEVKKEKEILEALIGYMSNKEPRLMIMCLPSMMEIFNLRPEKIISLISSCKYLYFKKSASEGPFF